LQGFLPLGPLSGRFSIEFDAEKGAGNAEDDGINGFAIGLMSLIKVG
jgi:hypothetical protein